jgi:uncharacterized protein (TIGR03437 family)
MGPANGVSNSGALPTELGGASVYFGGYLAPLLYVQSEQINAQVPWEFGLLGVPANVQVGFLGAPPQPVTPVVMAPALPGVFYVNNSDGSTNSPSNPAPLGSLISIYGTGGGAMNPPAATGQFWASAPLSYLELPVSVAIGPENALTQYTGSAPTLESGFFQINVLLPADLASGVQSLSVTIGGVTSAPVAITIQ